jgi:rubrerythrin
MFTEFRDPDSLEIASVFWDMAVEEKRHSTVLQERYVERYGNAACALTEEDLKDMIEVPRLDDGDVFAAAETANDTARERAVKVALAAEQSAQNYYSRLAEQTKDGPLRRLYNELATMEDGHVSYLENVLSAAASEDKGVH